MSGDQTFLETASHAISFCHRLRADAFAQIEVCEGDDHYLIAHAAALYLLASEDLIKEFQRQIDNKLDGLEVDKRTLLLLLECCERTWGLIERMDSCTSDPNETQEDNFYRGTEIRIELLEILSLIPDWPDTDVLQEKARIGGRMLTELRAGRYVAEDDFGEFEEYARHTGTILVRMVFADVGKTGV